MEVLKVGDFVSTVTRAGRPHHRRSTYSAVNASFQLQLDRNGPKFLLLRQRVKVDKTLSPWNAIDGEAPADI